MFFSFVETEDKFLEFIRNQKRNSVVASISKMNWNDKQFDAMCLHCEDANEYKRIVNMLLFETFSEDVLCEFVAKCGNAICYISNPSKKLQQLHDVVWAL